MSISGGVDKLANTYNRILFSHQKEFSIDACYNLNEPQKHTKKQKLDTKSHQRYDSMYLKYQEQVIQRQNRQLVARIWDKEEM